MMGLVAFVERNWPTLEADFQAVYRIDLRSALWGPEPVGCRRLLALVECLPAGAVTLLARAVEPDPEPALSTRDAVRKFFGGGD